MTSKQNKFRKNVQDFVDQDYRHKLSKEELDYLDKFNDEYYCNGVNKEGSIHKENLSEEDFEIAKKETYSSTNSQNRDGYAISGTGNYLKFIESDEFYDELIQPLKKMIDFIDPQLAFNILLEEVVEEISNDGGRELELILVEMSIEMVKLGASISQQRAQKVLKRRREKKEEKLKQQKEKK